MQTPQGYEIVDGRFVAVDWFAVVFNPSFPYRFAHMVCAAYITTGFVVLSVGAWLIRKGQFVEEGRLMFSITLWLLLLLVPLQVRRVKRHGQSLRKLTTKRLSALPGDRHAKRMVSHTYQSEIFLGDQQNFAKSRVVIGSHCQAHHASLLFGHVVLAGVPYLLHRKRVPRRCFSPQVVQQARLSKFFLCKQREHNCVCMRSISIKDTCATKQQPALLQRID
jgi:Cytochrome bd terminal oxidase subunit I